MSSWDSYETSGAAARQHCFEVDIGQTLQGQTSAYSILDFIGEGCFGKVAKCQKVDSKQTVAVKILNDHEAFKDMESEVSMLEEISILNPAHTNIVQLVEQFEYMGLYCLAFEKLDMDLYTFMDQRSYMSLSMNEIRPIAQQLLVALDALKGLGIMHCDIKPDNVMFVDLQDQSLRVKLIDFGEAMRASQAHQGMMVQPYGYRAPEVSLGFPFTEAIDIWGVGCVLAYLLLGDNLFPVNCEYQMVKCAVDLLGYPEDHLLRTGKYSNCYFTVNQSPERTAWRLLTPEEYAVKNNKEAQERQGYFEFPSSLDGLVNLHPETQAAKVGDKKAFVDLLKGLLQMNGEQRLTPRQALQHPFVTMSHLKEAKRMGYLMISEEFMQICPEASSPSDLLCVSSDINIQSDAPKTSGSIGQDSGVWSLPETKDQDSEDWSLPETKDQDSEDWSLPETKDQDSEDWSLPETKDQDSEDWSLPETKDQDSEDWSLPETKDQDSEDWSLPETKEDVSSVWSCDLRVPPGHWDERKPIYYSHSDVPFIFNLSDCAASVPSCDGDDTQVIKVSKRFSFQRISRFFRRVKDAFCCCVHQQEDD